MDGDGPPPLDSRTRRRAGARVAHGRPAGGRGDPARVARSQRDSQRVRVRGSVPLGVEPRVPTVRAAGFRRRRGGAGCARLGARERQTNCRLGPAAHRGAAAGRGRSRGRLGRRLRPLPVVSQAAAVHEVQDLHLRVEAGDSVGFLLPRGQVDLGVRTRPRPDGAVQWFTEACEPCHMDGGTGTELLFDATIEPDFDEDGLGDDTQDPDAGFSDEFFEDDEFDDWFDELEEDEEEDSTRPRRRLRLLDLHRARNGDPVLQIAAPSAGRLSGVVTTSGGSWDLPGIPRTIGAGEVRVKRVSRQRLRLRLSQTGRRKLNRRGGQRASRGGLDPLAQADQADDAPGQALGRPSGGERQGHALVPLVIVRAIAFVHLLEARGHGVSSRPLGGESWRPGSGPRRTALSASRRRARGRGRSAPRGRPGRRRELSGRGCPWGRPRRRPRPQARALQQWHGRP